MAFAAVGCRILTGWSSLSATLAGHGRQTGQV